MEQLTAEQQANLRKMSSERIQGRLMRVGLDEEEIYAMDRETLLTTMAEVMYRGDDTMVKTAETKHAQVTDAEVRLMELQLQRDQQERQFQLQEKQLQMQLDMQERQLRVQMEMQSKVIEMQQGLHDSQQQARALREENIIAKTKRYGQAVQYALYKMPQEAGELPAYFDAVDNIWETYGVPNELKAKLLVPQLTARAKSLITKLPLVEQNDYTKLKEYLLKQHQLGPREYRARFVHAVRNPGETWVAFTSRLANSFKYYTNSRNCKSVEELADLCVCDKLRDTLPLANLKHCLLAEKDPNISAQDLARLADDYESNFWADGRYKGQSVTVGVNPGPRFDHKRGNRDGGDTTKPSSPRFDRRQSDLKTNSVTGVGVARASDPALSVRAGNPMPTQSQFGKRNFSGKSPPVDKTPLRCWKCGEVGHKSSAHKNPGTLHTPHAVNYTRMTPDDYSGTTDAAACKNTDSVLTNQINRCVVADPPRAAIQVTERVNIGKSPSEDMFFDLEQTFMARMISDEGVSITSPLTYVAVELEGCKQPYHAMIDTGAMVAVAKISVIPPQLRESLGKTRLQGAFGECVDAELSTLRVRLLPRQPGIETPFIPVVFALTDALASKECDMLLPAHAASELHAYGEVYVVTENSPPDNYNECHDVKAGSCNICDATDSYGSECQAIHTLLNGDSDSCSIASDDDLDQDHEVDNVDLPPIEITNPSNLELLIKEQQDDQTLAPYWAMAKQNKGRMYIKQGLLYHQDTVGGLPVEQLAVPVNRRDEVVRLAHQTLTGGHMRAQKTRERLRLHFFFPGMRKLVFQTLARCRECQLRASQKVSDNVPIKPIVRPTLPFMVAHADLIGPLDPVSSQGHAHALCIVDACTRWPTVYLLRSTQSKAICDCFIDLFQNTGVYQTIIMDNGSNLCSKLTTEFLTRLGVSPRFITPYHCQANGLVERFNQSFKSMLHFAMREHGRSWHKAVPFLVWCMREVPNATTGVSPFMMQHGVQPRGVLALLKEHWSGFQALPTNKPVEQYLSQLRKHLEVTREFAEKHTSVAQEQYAKYYNAHTCDKTFKENEEVIILEKDSGSKTFARWQTGTVVRVLSPYSYIVAMPNGSRRHLHANRMRKLVLHSYNVGIVNDSDVDFGDISVAPTQAEQAALPSKLVDKETLNHLTATERDQLLCLLDEFCDCFSEVPGLCDKVQHSIHTTPDFVPKRTRAYRVPEVLKVEIERQIDELLRLGFIEPSDSPMTSGVVCVVKPNRSVRLCCDFRYLNSFTVPDPMPMKILTDCVHKVSSASCISICDAKSGFWQVLIKPEDRWKSAFVTHHGVWQWCRMPFGLRNAPGTFVRLMQTILYQIRETSDAYMDDAWTMSKDFQSHLLHLRKFLIVIRDAGITLSLAKCKFAQTRVPFVGFIVGNGEFFPDPSKTSAVANMTAPCSKSEVKRVLGIFSFYRAHIRDFARVAKPLTDLTNSRTPAKFQLSAEAFIAFEELKKRICNAPVLASPRFDTPFVLYTDASLSAVGCCLAQLHSEDGSEHPVAYGSQKLSPTQSNWSTIEREAYAVIWALGKYRTLLYGASVVVVSDHNPLRFLAENAPRSAKLTRWALALQDYDITLKHIKGSKNALADGLSRA